MGEGGRGDWSLEILGNSVKLSGSIFLGSLSVVGLSALSCSADGEPNLGFFDDGEQHLRFPDLELLLGLLKIHSSFFDFEISLTFLDSEKKKKSPRGLMGFQRLFWGFTIFLIARVPFDLFSKVVAAFFEDAQDSSDRCCEIVSS